MLAGCAGSPSSNDQNNPVPSSTAGQINGELVEVQRGDTLGKLANRANVPLERLERFNPGVNAQRLNVGQRLLIPTQQERAPSGGPYRYQIRPGDTYSSIARHFGTTAGRIQSANPGSSPTALRVGQIVSVPLSSGTSRSSSTSRPAVAAPMPNTSLPASARRWPWPLEDYRIVRRFGADSRGTLQPMLLATQAGAKAQAVAPGEVRFADGMRQLGDVVIIHHADNLQTVYALCERILVRVGQQVSAGDPLCDVGQSSTTQRYDLLFDLRQGGKPIDPRQVLR
ncbi:LysM peptidoglycan-binding domain-containing protein [Vreelandella venusta]|uniref:LysM peptidoglycan-binding domain-containing protein n=1 Tax=Vreelandella venusta TaxID=44935 RepID=UPI00228639C9|nr:LysM peptidoglycan-binding domain-containing protein [Halomonas venusta]WAM50471.1 LysM peptidoglycan-binding domain-containing protein [Halomonas venusta]WAM53954.1 LysM peptidoglycan-binding domain-containing protein [Halomonas venusta]